MAEGQAAFKANFIYTEAILQDFEALYRQKQHMSPSARILCAVLGAVGSVYFAWQLYTEGLGVTRIGYLLACSLMLLVAFSGTRGKTADETLQKYRRHYKNCGVQFRIDENGVEMQLEKQKKRAKSKFSEIYGLFETKQCFYFVIKGKAYYIISKSAITGGDVDSFRHYMEKHCKKKTQFYDLSEKKA